MLTAYLVLQALVWLVYGFVVYGSTKEPPRDAVTWAWLAFGLFQIAAPVALLLVRA